MNTGFSNVEVFGDLNYNSFGGVLEEPDSRKMVLEETETTNMGSSFKKFSIKRKERNGAVARWGSGVMRVLFFFFLSRKTKSISQKDEGNG